MVPFIKNSLNTVINFCRNYGREEEITHEAFMKQWHGLSETFKKQQEDSEKWAEIWKQEPHKISIDQSNRLTNDKINQTLVHMQTQTGCWEIGSKGDQAKEKSFEIPVVQFTLEEFLRFHGTDRMQGPDAM